MDNRAPLIVSIMLIVIMEAISLIAWFFLPDVPVAIHFDIAGRADGFAPLGLALSIMPLTAIFITLLYAVLPRTGARDGNRLLARSKGWIAVWVGTVLMLAILHVLIVLRAAGYRFDMVANVTFITAALLMVTGNFLGKIAPNDWAGIRTPWTRASDYAWEKTNRLGGWMIAGTGLATLVALFWTGSERATYVLMAGVASLFVLVPLSRHYWKNDPER